MREDWIPPRPRWPAPWPTGTERRGLVSGPGSGITERGHRRAVRGDPAARGRGGRGPPPARSGTCDHHLLTPSGTVRHHRPRVRPGIPRHDRGAAPGRPGPARREPAGRDPRLPVRGWGRGAVRDRRGPRAARRGLHRQPRSAHRDHGARSALRDRSGRAPGRAPLPRPGGGAAGTGAEIRPRLVHRHPDVLRGGPPAGMDQQRARPGHRAVRATGRRGAGRAGAPVAHRDPGGRGHLAADARLAGLGDAPPGHSRSELAQKSAHASYIVTQMCFEAAPLLAWISSVRDQGIELSVRPGVAGPVGLGRLLRIGTRVGVGTSLRMLGSQGSGMRRLVTPGTWAPEILLDDLTEAYADPRYGLDGVHIYTFNALEQTARWWDEHSDRRWHSGRR